MANTYYLITSTNYNKTKLLNTTVNVKVNYFKYLLRIRLNCNNIIF